MARRGALSPTAAAMTAHLAKLTRPRLHGVAERERVFLDLDDACERGIVWLAALPGAGKTTAIATWVQSRGLHDIWFQADAGDGDPATFFLFLSASLPAAGRSRSSPGALPSFTPEHLGNLAGFGRRYFRDYFSRLPANAVLVLDNFQEIPDSSALHAALAAGLAEVPAGCTLVVISRAAPPDPYARLVANRAVAILDWERLRLTPDETRAIVSIGMTSPAPDLAERLHRQCDGWAAGLTLMLERLRHGGLEAEDFEAETRDASFLYFAGEVFDRLPEEHQDILLACAFLPRATAAQAAALSGVPVAGKVLDALCRRHLFTHRRLGRDAVYEFHALFHDFLSAEASKRLSADRQAGLATKAGQVLEQSGQPESAISAYLRASRYEDACRLIRAVAPDWMRCGRGLTLADAIARLPEETVKSDPALCYWHACALVPVRPDDARRRFESAIRGFERLGDAEGELLSLCGMVEAHFIENIDFTRLEPWRNALDRTWRARGGTIGPETEIRVLSTVVLTATVNVNWLPANVLADYAARLEELMRSDAHPAGRVAAAHTLVRYMVWSGDLDPLASMASEVEHIVGDPGVRGIDRYLWYLRAAHGHLFRGDAERAARCIDQARDEADGLPPHPTRVTLAVFSVARALLAGQTADAHAALRQCRTLARTSYPLEAATQCVGEFYVAAHRGDWPLALKQMRRAVDGFDAAGALGPVVEFTICLVHALHRCGHTKEAAQTASTLDARAGHSFLRHFRACVATLRACWLLEAGETSTAARILRSALPAMRPPDWYTLHMLADVLPRVAAFALRHELHADLVRAAILGYSVFPPEGQGEAWPHAVRIRVIGAFKLVTTPPLLGSAKAAHKVLRLLRMIAALGGEAVPASKLADALWPHTDGDVARRNLDVYLTRLRKLLGRTDALCVRDHRVSLNSAVCWLDLRDFQRACERVQRLKPADRDWENTAAVVRSLYRGDLLADEDDDPWIASSRRRLRAVRARAVDSLVNGYLALGRPALAADVLSEALAIGPEDVRWRTMLASIPPAAGHAGEVGDARPGSERGRKARAHLPAARRSGRSA